MTTGSRHQAREAALQILYSCEIGGAPGSYAAASFFAEHLPEAADAVRAFARELVDGTLDSTAELDALIAEHSRHWRLERLATIDRLILRMAAWELQRHPDTPPAVVIDEAIELARTFSTDDSVKFVNGVLDGISKTLEATKSRPGPADAS
jgi:N utilization substance protein B